MTLIRLNLANNSINGEFVITPDHMFVSNGKQIVIDSFRKDIIPGVVTEIEIPESEGLNGLSFTYTWEAYQVKDIVEFFLLSGVQWTGGVNTDLGGGLYSTGLKYVNGESKRLELIVRKERKLIFNIKAVCPKDPSVPVDFTDLIPVPSQSPWVGIGVRQLAKLLTDPDSTFEFAKSFAEQIASDILHFTGVFTPGTLYNTRDVASYNGSSYIYMGESIVLQADENPEDKPELWNLLAKGADAEPVAASTESEIEPFIAEPEEPEKKTKLKAQQRKRRRKRSCGRRKSSN
ncbi:hypothetical protein [Moorena sp. SIO3A2]|uniref:hypothetical protein n=1 Tax=Moorena sp. SIO3A2 TaxID=2607841 RepID=UPI0013BB371B|nr:hypothetical protein [Moorena sp. SIO3A2]NER90356.1 hypothetical protein [Moorena sp. SIO3A2]